MARAARGGERKRARTSAPASSRPREALPPGAAAPARPPRTPPGTATLVLHDPGTMRALAHPLRMRLLRLLRHRGEATASALAAAVGTAPAAASYHLRVLAEHGFIEEAPGRGDGRERWWRASHEGTTVTADVLESPQTRTAAVAMSSTSVRHAAQVALAWLDAVERGDVEREWVEAAATDQSGIYVTAAELDALVREIEALVARFAARRSDPALRPDGARLVHVSLEAVPWLQP